jgi:hypothetical protein
VIFNEGQPGREETLAGTPGATDQSTIPVIGTSFAIGEELYNQVRAGTVTVRVATTTEIRRNVPMANLIAKTKTGRTDRQVSSARTWTRCGRVGPQRQRLRHGSGLEIALQMAKLGVKPANQTMFAFWGAEESGLIPSQFYVDSLSSRQVKDTAVNLNFDMVGSPNFVRFVYDGDASDKESLASTGSGVVEDVFLDYFSSQSLPVEPTAFDGRSDYDAFIRVGIPAGGWFTGAEGVKTPEQAAVYGGRAGIAYDPCYHQACDTIDNLSMTALDHMSDAAAHAALTFAQSGSAVEGTDKGKSLGHGDHQGSHLRKYAHKSSKSSGRGGPRGRPSLFSCLRFNAGRSRSRKGARRLGRRTPREPRSRAAPIWGCGYGLAGQAGVSKPPSPTVSGALPTSLGIKPKIGPPLAAEAGVMSVWLAPSLAIPTQRNGVMP